MITIQVTGKTRNKEVADMWETFMEKFSFDECGRVLKKVIRIVFVANVILTALAYVITSLYLIFEEPGAGFVLLLFGWIGVAIEICLAYVALLPLGALAEVAENSSILAVRAMTKPKNEAKEHWKAVQEQVKEMTAAEKAYASGQDDWAPKGTKSSVPSSSVDSESNIPSCPKVEEKYVIPFDVQLQSALRLQSNAGLRNKMQQLIELEEYAQYHAELSEVLAADAYHLRPAVEALLTKYQ